MKGSRISIFADERSLVVLNILLASIICLGCLPGLAGPVRFQPSSLQAGEPPWYGYYNRTINPPEMKDIDQLVLWKGRTPAAMAPAGLYANAMGFQHGPRIGYRMTGRILTAAKLIFTTEAVQGISYKFSGRFVKSGLGGQGDDWGVEGRLIKLKNGRKVAEGEIQFSYGGPV
jgi:hypothetical protein